MKKVLALVMVFSMVSMANAGLGLLINDSAEDVTTVTGPLVGAVDAFDGQLANVGMFICWNEFLAVDFSSALNTVGAGSILPIDDADILALLGAKGAIFADLAIPAIPVPTISGKVVNGLGLNWLGKDAQQVGVLSLVNGDTFEVVSAMNVIPEPMTLSLLGLGALVLRRRS